MGKSSDRDRNVQNAAGGEFSDRLRAIMRERGVSQEALAKRLGMSIRTVGRWVRGETSPDVSIVAAIEKALGLAVGELHPGRPGDRGADVINRVSQYLDDLPKARGEKPRQEATKLIARIQHDLSKLQLILMGIDLKEPNDSVRS